MHEFVKTLVQLAASQLVILLTLSVGLSIDVGSLRRELKNPVLWRTLLVALVAVPALAVLLAAILPLPPLGRGVLVLMAVSPGAPFIMNRARGNAGNVCLAVALAVVLTLAALVVMPAQLWILNRLFQLHFEAPIPALLGSLLPRLVVPLAVGVVLRQAWPHVAIKLEPIAGGLFRLALALVAVGALAIAWRQIAHAGAWAWVAMVIVTLGALALGDAAGAPDLRDRRTAAFAVVLGNPALAIHVARFSYPSLKIVPIILAYVVVRALLVLPYGLASKRRFARSSA